MPTTVITIDAFKAALAECADAISSEDWASAIKWYARAEAIHTGLDFDISDQTMSIRRRDALRGLREAIEAARSIAEQESDDRDRLGVLRTRF